MKRLLPLLFLVACHDPHPSCDPTIKKFTINYGSWGQRSFTVYVIDQCEYIGANLGSGYDAGLLTHKGNCRYCAERAAQRTDTTYREHIWPNSHP